MIELFYVLSEDKKYFSLENKNIQLTEYENKVSREEIFDYIKFLESQSYDNLNLEDIYIYDGIPLYYYFRDILYARIDRLFNCIKIIDKLKNEFQNKKIKVLTDSSVMYNVATELFKLDCTKIKIPKKPKKQVNFENKDKWHTRIERGVQHFKEFKNQYLFKDNFLVFSHAMDINMVNDKLNKEQFYYDTQLGCLIDKLKEQYNVFNIQLCNESSLNKSIECNMDYYPYEGINNIVDVDNIEIKNDKIIINNEIIEKLNYNYHNFNLEKIIKNNFFNDYKEICSNELRKIIIVMEIFKELKIQKCLIMDETYSGRLFVFAANMLNIKNYATQHGMITDKRFSQFINSKYDNMLVPTKTFVWGKVFKEKLINNGNIYSNSNVFISGQVRTDIIYKYYFKIKKEESNFSSDENTKINILYTTQNEEDIHIPTTKMLFKALKNLNENYMVIIKLHPSDHNYKFYSDMVEKYNINNIKIVQDYDILLLIEWCDLIVNVFSTVTQEALLFNKKSICIQLPKYGDTSGYIKSGIALAAQDEYELLNNIKNFRKENIISDKVINEFIINNFYKIDGNVANRIIKEVMVD